MRILCSISTKGRTHTTLPLAIQSVTNQTRKPDKLIDFDDNVPHQPLGNDPLYSQLFSILSAKAIPWEWRPGKGRGQHHNHQAANNEGFDWVWRVDDDCFPEPNVLETLERHLSPSVGAVGGSILTLGIDPGEIDRLPITGEMRNVDTEPNMQWGYHNRGPGSRVDHLHCSFLYRAGVSDYDTGLSHVAHREETLFTWSLRKRGYELWVVPHANSWHIKFPTGGIRTHGDTSSFQHDEARFRRMLGLKDKTIVVLDCGLEDHRVFEQHLLPLIRNPEVFARYPDIIPGRSIREARELLGSIDNYDVHKKMADWKWTGSVRDAFRKIYMPWEEWNPPGVTHDPPG